MVTARRRYQVIVKDAQGNVQHNSREYTSKYSAEKVKKNHESMNRAEPSRSSWTVEILERVLGPTFAGTQTEIPSDQIAVATDAVEGQQFNATLEKFVAHCQEQINENYARKNFQGKPDEVSIDPNGMRYVRIVRRYATEVITAGGPIASSNGSVHCFVDKLTGDILKADSWKKPAKHARGNLYKRETWATATTAYGGAYLR